MDRITSSALVCSITVARLPRGARHPLPQEAVRTNGRREAIKFRWEDSAGRVNEIYHEVLSTA
jgi:hypothetical protein